MVPTDTSALVHISPYINSENSCYCNSEMRYRLSANRNFDCGTDCSSDTSAHKCSPSGTCIEPAVKVPLRLASSVINAWRFYDDRTIKVLRRRH